MIEELRPLFKKFIVFAKDNLTFKRPPRLFLRKDTANQKCTLGKTAHYDPQKMAITLYISGRHPKDILRSFAHELVHHCQNERGDLAPEKMKTMNKNYAQENDHMRTMEKEAYLMGNMCFRDWEDGLDDKLQYKMQIAEQKFLKENKNMSVKLKRKDLKGLIEKLLESRSSKGNINENPVTKSKTLNFEKGMTIKAKTTKLPLEVEKAFEELKAELAKMGPAISPEAMAALKKMTAAATEDTHTPVAGEETSLQKEEILDEKHCGAHNRNDDNMNITAAGKKCDKEGNCPPGAGCKPCDDKRALEEAKVEEKSTEETEGSKIQTPEQENTLYESRFTGRNTRLFEKLLKEWTK